MRLRLYPSEKVTRTQPVNLNEADTNLFRNEFEKRFEEIYSEKFLNVKILPNGAIVQKLIKQDLFFCKSIPLKGAIKVKSLIKLYLNTVKLLFKSSKVTRIDNALFLTNFYSDNFFHWFGDVLQKIEAIQNREIDLNEYTLIIPAKCDNSYTRFTLDQYKINYYIMEKNEIVRSKNLLYVPLISPAGNFRPKLMVNIRNRFISPEKKNSKSKRIYISRKDAPKRQIVNENELLPIVSGYNFSVIAMERLALEDQINCVAEADTLLSLHGAGLTHMLWMPKGSKVIEIRERDDSRNNVFFSLASALELKYYYILADKTDQQPTQKTNFKVDVEAFEEELERILNDE